MSIRTTYHNVCFGAAPNLDLRDYERVPLTEEVDAYFEREVRPHVPDAWMDRSKDRVGYEINFNLHFYDYTRPRPLKEIGSDLKVALESIERAMEDVVG